MIALATGRSASISMLVSVISAKATAELPHGAQQACAGAVTDQHAADQLRGKYGQRNLPGHLRRQGDAQSFVLTLQDAENHRLQQSILVREAALDSSRRQPRVLRDPGNRRALDSVLPEHFRRSFQELAHRFAAAGP